jgi:transcriptional regulator with XRE-family HTH domain
MAKRLTGAERLRASMAANGWSQGELAGRLRVPQATVSRWLSGERKPTLEMLDRIREVTGIPFEAWLDKRTGSD